MQTCIDFYRTHCFHKQQNDFYKYIFSRLFYKGAIYIKETDITEMKWQLWEKSFIPWENTNNIEYYCVEVNPYKAKNQCAIDLESLNSIYFLLELCPKNKNLNNKVYYPISILSLSKKIYSKE